MTKQSDDLTTAITDPEIQFLPENIRAFLDALAEIIADKIWRDLAETPGTVRAPAENPVNSK